MLTLRRSEDRGHVDHGWLNASDMEILTYVIEGALQHKDNMGNGSVIRPGDVQWMSAGTGIQHSEFNPSPDDPTHLLQIWILPDRQGRQPDYAEKNYPEAERRDQLRLVASGDGADNSIRWGQDVRLYASVMSAGQDTALDLAAGRHAWVQVVRGVLDINGKTLGGGDGAAVSDESRLEIKISEESEFLVFDLP